MLKKISWFFLLFFTTIACAESSTIWVHKDTNQKNTLPIYLFLSTTCTHCQKADSFFTELEKQNPQYKVIRFKINTDENALKEFAAKLKEQNQEDFRVPSIFFCDSRWVGFDTPETTGNSLTHALNFCQEQVDKQGELTPETIGILKRLAYPTLLVNQSQQQSTSWVVIPILAIIDAFNPCALFVLAGFCAFVILLRKNKDGSSLVKLNSSVVWGLILMIGLVHFLQQSQTNYFYQLLPYLRLPAVLVGIYLLWFIYNYYKTGITNKIAIYGSWLGIVFLMFYQQTCILSWSLFFQQWLEAQNLSLMKTIFFQMSYLIIYLLPLIVLSLLIKYFLRRFHAQSFQNRLDSIVMLYVVAMAILLIAYPWGLANLGWSILTLVPLGALGWMIAK